jgi:hypothetical protein
MSVLHQRIMAQGAGAPVHPYGTGATPMQMPLAIVTHGEDELAIYGTMVPLYTTDGAVIPAHAASYFNDPRPAPVVPAGRP